MIVNQIDKYENRKKNDDRLIQNGNKKKDNKQKQMIMMKMTMKKTKQTTMEPMDEFVCLFSLFLFFKDNFHIYSCIFINKKKSKTLLSTK